MPRKIPVLVILILILVVGAIFRTYRLGRVVVWHDEAMTFMHCSGNPFVAKLVRESLTGPWKWADIADEYQNKRCSLDEVSSAVRISHPEHAPGFYEALHFWRLIFDPESTIVMRLFPVLFGLLCLPAFYWFALELFRKPGQALLATAMLTVSPLQIMYSQELREYSLYSLLFALSCAALLRAWRTNRLRDWLMYCVILIPSIYSTFLMLIVVGAHILYTTFATLLQKARARRGHFRFHAVKWSSHMISVGVALLVVSPILLSLMRSCAMAVQMVKWVELPMTPILRLRFWAFSPLFNWAFYPRFQYPYPGGMEDWLLQLLAILALQLTACVHLFRREKPQAWFLLLIALAFAAVFWLPDILDGGRRATVVRYFLPLTMITTLPMSYMLYHLWQSQKRVKRIFAACFVVFLFGCQIRSDLALANCPEHALWHYDIKPIAKIIANDPSALIIADHKTVSSAQVLAIGRLLDEPSREFVWIYLRFPDWLKKIDHGYVLHAQPNVVRRFESEGFEVKWVDANRRLLLVRPIAKPAGAP